jgi:hypothetical protein
MKKAAYVLLVGLIFMVLLCGFSFYAVAQAGLPVEPTRRPPISATLVPEPNTETACIAAGGEWIRVGGFDPKDICDMPAPDAGMPCSDFSECAGYCLGTNASFFADMYWPYVIGECSATIHDSGAFEVRDGHLTIISYD